MKCLISNELMNLFSPLLKADFLDSVYAICRSFAKLSQLIVQAFFISGFHMMPLSIVTVGLDPQSTPLVCFRSITTQEFSLVKA